MPKSPPPPRRSVDPKKLTALGVTVAASALLAGFYAWMVKPAAAREATAACNGMKGNPVNPALGAIPREAPDFKVTSWDGKELDLKQLRGKTVLVHYWASWCGACEQEKPSLMRMAEEMQSPDFRIVAIASDIDWKSVERALPHGAPFQVYLDKPAEEGTIGPLATSWGTHAVPESFLIDKQGKIRYYFDNSRQWDSPVTETCLQSIIDE